MVAEYVFESLHLDVISTNGSRGGARFAWSKSDKSRGKRRLKTTSRAFSPGEPEAAELGGIKTRWTIFKAFTLMGLLVVEGAAVHIACLHAGTSGLGTLTELSGFS